MSHEHHNSNDAEPPAVEQGESSAPVPNPPQGESEAPRGRARWAMAAAASLGVVLLAVPLLRGLHVPVQERAAQEQASAPGGAGSCSTARGRANLDFTLEDIDGNSVRLADYKGKVILLNFWATWCGPCKTEIPEFVEAYEEYRDQGFVILGVLSEDDASREDLRAFMSEFSMNYPVLRENTEFSDSFGQLWALPTSFIIDRHGTICMKHMGAVSKEMLEREIEGLL